MTVTKQIKGRYVVVGGSKQQAYEGYEKPNESSPTLITNYLFFTGVIDVKKNQTISKIDAINTFL